MTNTQMIQAAKDKADKDYKKHLCLDTWLDIWFERYKVPNITKGTQDMYLHAIGLIRTCDIAYIPLKDITETDIQIMFNRLSQRGNKTQCGRPYSKSILEKIGYTLNQSLKKAYKLGHINKNPYEDITIPKASEKKIFPLSAKERILMEEHCAVHPLGYLIIFLLDTGLRANELCNLKWDDYNSELDEIYIRQSKTEAGIRTVPLLSRPKQIIEHQKRTSEYIFTKENTKERITYYILQRVCRDLRKSTGITTFTSHVCRHTFVTRLVEEGASVEAIAQIIGHSDHSYVLSIYAWLEKEQLRKEIMKLEKVPDTSVTLCFSDGVFSSLKLRASEKYMSVNEYIFTLIKKSINEKT